MKTKILFYYYFDFDLKYLIKKIYYQDRFKFKWSNSKSKDYQNML